MTISPAIIVMAYNRNDILLQLLEDLNNAIYKIQNITLVISVDKSGTNEIVETAHAFKWEHGTKKVIEHPAHLGLLNHFIYCGALSVTLGPLILLEDDLRVSPYFYDYALAALTFYAEQKNIAGISLYNYLISESSLTAFTPPDDGSSVYFMQYPSSWGLCLSPDQWLVFEEQFKQGNLNADNADPIFIRQWPTSSWKRFMVRYLIQENKYFVFPRLSVSTNTGTMGTNTPVRMDFFQVPLQVSYCEWTFIPKDKSLAVFDSYFEILPEVLNKMTNKLCSYDYAVDLQGCKPSETVKQPYLLSVRRASENEMGFGSDLKPLLMNIVMNNKGKDISLISTAKARGGKFKLHYGHTAFVQGYLHKGSAGLFTFIKYFYLYIKFDMHLWLSRFKKK